MLTAARIIYAKYWKQNKVPKLTEWLDKLVFFTEMDKISKKLKEQVDTEYKREWCKLKNYLEKRWKSQNFTQNLGEY